MNIEKLIKLISLDIPKPSKKEIGFLEIIRKGHDENINSRIYAYFLDTTIHPEIASVFLTALLRLIKEKSKINFELDNYEPMLEVATSKGRIDIVLLQTDRKKVILIENKIYHHLSNPLEDYWNHFVNLQEENKFGVLLTLKPSKSEHKFYNITHIEWIEKIREIGLPFNIEPRTHIYLNDFFNTIIQLSKNIKMDEQAKFFFENTSKIQEAINTKVSAINYINSQIDSLASKFGLKISGSGANYVCLIDETKTRNVFYTIGFEGILNGTDRNYLIIQINNIDKQKANEILNKLKNVGNYELNKISFLDGLSGKSFVHFAIKQFCVEKDHVETFFESLNSEMNKDFKLLMEDILEFFQNQDQELEKYKS